MNRIHSCVASILALIGAVALAGVFYLVYLFPRTEVAWGYKGRALSAAEQALAQLSNLCKSFGLLIMPALLFAVIGCGVWAVLARKGSGQSSANKALEDIGA
jgi:type II secretory pathway component PulF